MPKLTHFVLDVDGVLTDGRFYYTEDGKVMKAFGAHDADGLAALRDKLHISFISADRRGFSISEARTYDMGYPISLVSGEERFGYLDRLGFDNLIFMGDGFHDAPCLARAAIGIAPANAVFQAKVAADYTTSRQGGHGAVFEACHIIKGML
jgi:3-deoxy-D-manno-octulosonate 8-phosphate phosphatase (KDO 8-P phosphatase)